MKNLPQRERAARRTHGKYAEHGKGSHVYSWATTREGRVPLPVLEGLHAARLEAFGRGYKGEDRDLDAIGARKRAQR